MNDNDASRGEMVLAMFFQFIMNPCQTPADIQKNLRISKDKYYRYFSEISRVVPVRYDRKERRFEFSSNTALRGFMNDPQEFYTFLLAMQAAGRGKTNRENGAVKTFEGMPGFGSDFDAITKFIIFISPHDSSPQLSTNLCLINNGVHFSRRIRFTYTKPKGETYEAVVEPYRIIFDNCWYLFGFALHRNATRNYRISRMKNVVITDDKFQMPPIRESQIGRIYLPWDFNDSPPAKVLLEFDEGAFGYLKEKAFHYSEEYSPVQDGRFRYSVKVTSPLNMVSWILSFGRHVKVLEPESLKEAVVNDIGIMREMYV